MSADLKTETELKEEQSSPSSPKQHSKKRKPSITRRRTKTGCLTCRHRRVKCDEAKPTCRNCEKSRRQCAGYQPVQTTPMPTGSSMDSSSGYVSPLYSHHAHGNGYFPPYNQESHIPITSLPIDPSSGYAPVYLQHDAQDCRWPQAESQDGGEQPQLSPGHVWISSPFPNSEYNPYGMFSESSRRDRYRDHPKPEPLPLGATKTHAHLNDTPCGQRENPNHVWNPVAGLYEDPMDPFDVDTGDEYGESDAVINFRMQRNLILDERMAYLLKHFVTVLKPCMSIHERPVTFDGSSTFAEAIPNLALSCKGLLHGVMAVSALHLAVLHQTSEVIPLKHFLMASKKIAKLISTPSSRHKLETLTLCLLLAFYEVLLGDHARWVLHLRGAAAFLMEHDYAGFIRSTRKMRDQAKQNLAQSWIKHKSASWEDYVRVAGVPPTLLSDDEWDVDERFLSKLTGFEVDYTSQVQLSAKTAAIQGDLSTKDVQEWRTKLDLLFWYLKMDVFQSALSGDALLLPYENWKYFPPRGQMGCIDSAHATMDHLWLVLGRLTDFAAKDRARKMRKLATTGGEWMPEPGFLDGLARSKEHRAEAIGQESSSRVTNPPGANEGRTRMPRPSTNQPTPRKAPPLFFGMMPPPKIPPSMLSSFHVTDASLCKDKPDVTNESDSTSQSDLKAATKKALNDHAAISEALQAWHNALSPEYHPVTCHPSITEPPFSSILRYRDPSVATIWALYHLGKLLLRRCHPYSPPAMMVSAGVNALHTREDAEVIGRINAGLLEMQAELAKAGSMNPTLVAALQELTFPLMFAGVQYRNPGHRSWAIDSLLELADGSGWRSAYSVASALERAWEAQGDYKRTLHEQKPQESKKYDHRLSTGSIGSTPEAEHESRFVKHDRRLVDRFSDLRAFWAFGVLSSQDDLQVMLGKMHLKQD